MTTIVPRAALDAVQQNPFYEDLISVMTNPRFQGFCQKYMDSWSDIETIVLYMKLYQSLAQYLDTPQDIVAVIHKVMNTAHARKRVIQCFRDFQEGQRSSQQGFHAQSLTHLNFGCHSTRTG